jgi:hypothetical protein
MKRKPRNNITELLIKYRKSRELTPRIADALYANVMLSRTKVLKFQSTLDYFVGDDIDLRVWKIDHDIIHKFSSTIEYPSKLIPVRDLLHRTYGDGPSDMAFKLKSRSSSWFPKVSRDTITAMNVPRGVENVSGLYLFLDTSNFTSAYRIDKVGVFPQIMQQTNHPGSDFVEISWPTQPAFLTKGWVMTYLNYINNGSFIPFEYQNINFRYGSAFNGIDKFNPPDTTKAVGICHNDFDVTYRDFPDASMFYKDVRRIRQLLTVQKELERHSPDLNKLKIDAIRIISSLVLLDDYTKDHVHDIISEYIRNINLTPSAPYPILEEFKLFTKLPELLCVLVWTHRGFWIINRIDQKIQPNIQNSDIDSFLISLFDLLYMTPTTIPKHGPYNKKDLDRLNTTIQHFNQLMIPRNIKIAYHDKEFSQMKGLLSIDTKQQSQLLETPPVLPNLSISRAKTRGRRRPTISNQKQAQSPKSPLADNGPPLDDDLQIPELPLADNGSPPDDDLQIPELPLVDNGLPPDDDLQIPELPLADNGLPPDDDLQIPELPLADNGLPLDDDLQIPELPFHQVEQWGGNLPTPEQLLSLQGDLQIPELPLHQVEQWGDNLPTPEQLLHQGEPLSLQDDSHTFNST